MSTGKDSMLRVRLTQRQSDELDAIESYKHKCRRRVLPHQA
jgi:hypothetical protein